MLVQFGNVLPPLHQRGQVDNVKTQSIEQVIAKLVLPGHFTEVAVSSCNDPDIYLQGFLSPQPLELAVFNQPQQLFLQAC